MGSFIDLRADPDKMRASEGIIFNVDKFDNVDLENLNLDSSKSKLERDMRAKYNLHEINDPLLDQYVDKYFEDYQTSLMYLQIYNYYYTFNGGEKGDQNYNRMLSNLSLYDQMVDRWPRNQIESNITTISGVIILG